MRTVIGWMAALLGSALLGAAVYQTVLSQPLTELDPTATVERISGAPNPGPTLYRTEFRTVVEPTPTMTVEDEVLIVEEPVAASEPRTSNPSPARTSAPQPQSQPAPEREDSDDEDTEAPSDDADEPEDQEDDDRPEDSEDD